MKSFYLMFAGIVFFGFCALEWRGTSWDRNYKKPDPQYYSYRASSSSYGSSHRSSGGGYYYGSSSSSSYSSHK